MTDIALTLKEVFPHSRLIEFFNRGKMEAAAHQILRLLGGKTYEEWFEYFEANDFKPKNWIEAALLGKVMTVFYQGMVLEAEDAAQSWLDLSEGEREEYKSEALALAYRERNSFSFWEALVLTFYSFLVFHNFIRDLNLMEKYLDRYVAIVFEAVVSEKEISEDEEDIETAFRAIETGEEDQESPNLTSDMDSVYGMKKEKALAIFNSAYVDIPEAEREQKNQELRDMLKLWLEEDFNEQYNSNP